MALHAHFEHVAVVGAQQGQQARIPAQDGGVAGGAVLQPGVADNRQRGAAAQGGLHGQLCLTARQLAVARVLQLLAHQHLVEPHQFLSEAQMRHEQSHIPLQCRNCSHLLFVTTRCLVAPPVRFNKNDAADGFSKGQSAQYPANPALQRDQGKPAVVVVGLLQVGADHTLYLNYAEAVKAVLLFGDNHSPHALHHQHRYIHEGSLLSR